MEISYGFLLYATLYRLAIIILGAGCFILGYRLIINDPIGQGKTKAIFENGGFKVTLINFWPGIYFALFGTIVIFLMIWQGNPYMVMKELSEAKSTVDKENYRHVRMTEIRGNESDINYQYSWDKLSKPDLRLSDATKYIRTIANKWKSENRIGEALAYARLVVNVEPLNAENWVFLSELFQADGEHENAMQAMQKAAELNSKYSGNLHDQVRGGE
jgi:tetratricopeptide (TPR) repeat protein